MEDEQHFLFSCPAYNDVRQNYASLFQQAFSVSDFCTNFASDLVFAFGNAFAAAVGLCSFLPPAAAATQPNKQQQQTRFEKIRSEG